MTRLGRSVSCRHRSRGVITDVAALDVLDSFGQSTLGGIAEMALLRGAVTVIVVGSLPDSPRHPYGAQR